MRAAVLAFVLAFVIAFGAFGTTAYAEDDPLAEAMRLELMLDYDAALKILERAISQGGADRDKLVRLHLLAGKLAAGLDRVAVAEDHFARALALAPDKASFADGTSPKITEPFERARTRTKPLRITADIQPNAITIVPDIDPLGLVAGIAIKLAGSERELRDMQKRRIEIPTGARAVEVSALDAFGNRVWSQPIAAPETPLVGTTTLRPLYARWPFWATGTVIALGAAGVCAWRFDVTQDEWNRRKVDGMTNYSTLLDIEARGKRWALAANISFAAAGATTLIAIITAVRGSHTTAVVNAQADSVAFGVAGRF